MILQLHVDGSKAPAGWVGDVARLLRCYPGNQEVRLRVRMPSTGKTVEVKPAVRVDGWNRRLLTQLRALGANVTQVRDAEPE